MLFLDFFGPESISLGACKDVFSSSEDQLRGCLVLNVVFGQLFRFAGFCHIFSKEYNPSFETEKLHLQIMLHFLYLGNGKAKLFCSYFL